jgi:hypothetical protein
MKFKVRNGFRWRRGGLELRVSASLIALMEGVGLQSFTETRENTG